MILGFPGGIPGIFESLGSRRPLLVWLAYETSCIIWYGCYKTKDRTKQNRLLFSGQWVNNHGQLFLEIIFISQTVQKSLPYFRKKIIFGTAFLLGC